MKHENIAITQESILFEDWEKRDNRLSVIFKKNQTYNKEVDLCESIWQELKEIFSNDEHWSLIRDFETHSTYREVATQDLSYKQGYKDGIRTIIESLQST